MDVTALLLVIAAGYRLGRRSSNVRAVNWLAHVFLSEPNVEFQLGNLLADVVRGEQREAMSADFVRGAVLPRRGSGSEVRDQASGRAGSGEPLAGA